MFNPAERAKKLSKAIKKKLKEDEEYAEKQRKINKQNIKKRWENEQNNR